MSLPFREPCPGCGGPAFERGPGHCHAEGCAHEVRQVARRIVRSEKLRRSLSPSAPDAVQACLDAARLHEDHPGLRRHWLAVAEEVRRLKGFIHE